MVSTMWTRARRCVLAVALVLTAAPANAHLRKHDAWQDTLVRLAKLYPEADPNGWTIERHTFSEEDVVALEKELGFSLYAADKEPSFFLAHDTEGKFLGVALVVDARSVPKVVEGKVMTLDVGVGVDARGQIAKLALLDYAGSAALGERAFLDQIVGRNLSCSFKVGKGGMTPATDEPKESQLVADAAREALIVMRQALGAKGELAPCPLDPPPKPGKG